MIRPLLCSFLQTLVTNLRLTHNRLIAKSTNSTKFLGIIIKSSLTWKKFIDHINSKLNSLGYILQFLRSVLSLKIIKQIYTSYVHSVLNYGIIYWGNSSYTRIILVTQKRILMKANVRVSCWAVFSKIGILTLFLIYFLSSYVCCKA